MDDLISRQDIEWHHYLVADGNGMYHDEKVAYKSQIDDLPSAQRVHDCDTCRYNNLEWDEEPCDSCTMGGESCHWKPSAQPETKWIPCSERLPKEAKKTYWVCTDTEYQCECRWTNNRFGFGEGEWGWSIFDTPQYSKPIAWMPLPEPYRAERRTE